MDYCPEKCPKCDGKCRLPSRHGRILGRWEHVCNKNSDHKWPVKFVPTDL